MVDTPRTRSFILASLFQDGQAAGSITPNDVRDFVVSLIGPPVTVTPTAGAATWDLAVAPIATCTIVANTTITVTNGEDGMNYRLVIIQGGAGSFVPTLSGVTLSGTPAWATVAGAHNRVYIDMVGSTRMADVV